MLTLSAEFNIIVLIFMKPVEIDSVNSLNEGLSSFIFKH